MPSALLHGPAPRVTVCATRKDMIAAPGQVVAEFAASDDTSLAILAKGLEFDRFIVADASAEVHATEMNRYLHYVV